MNRNKNAGLLLIALGTLFLGNKILAQLGYDFLFWAYYWPLYILVPGLILETIYFKRKKAPGILIPGGILTTIGLLHFFEIATEWSYSIYTWPVYTLSVVIGFYQYWFITKEKWSLIIGTIFGFIFALQAFIVVSMFTDGIVSVGTLFSVLLIGLGLYLVIGKKSLD